MIWRVLGHRRARSSRRDGDCPVTPADLGVGRVLEPDRVEWVRMTRAPTALAVLTTVLIACSTAEGASSRAIYPPAVTRNDVAAPLSDSRRLRRGAPTAIACDGVTRPRRGRLATRSE